MKYPVDETHNPKIESWVESANDPNTDFPIQNLPVGVFEKPDDDDLPSLCVAIGDQVLDLSALSENLWEINFADLIGDEVADACSYESLNYLMMLGSEAWSDLRSRIFNILRADNEGDDRYIAEDFLIPMSEVRMLLPVEIGNYTDFYASIFHATNIGKMFRPENPLLPNYKWLPIGYHGRASSVVIGGSDIYRPSGQTMDDNAASPVFGPSKVLDYELELGFFVGQGTNLGSPLDIREAEDHIFGLCLVNDWSARDIQRWEYQPLGPFLSKSFATSVSPWIVTMEALAPFRSPAYERPESDPQPLAYLDSAENREHGGFDITLEAYLSTQKMREIDAPPQRLSRGNSKDLYWTFAQMLTHHTSNGCNLREGDLIASGTVSGATKESMGSLIELTQRGAEPIKLPNGEERRFLEDGDEVILRGYCERDGFRRIGFGECRGRIISATT